MAKTLTKAALALLATIVAAGPNGTFAAEAALKPLLADKLVEVNAASKDAQGNVAVRATPEGVAMSGQQAGASAAVANGATTPESGPTGSKFVIEDDVEMPTSLRASRESVYPFDQLAKGQSFFVPNTESKPDAAKSLASTVSSANLRYSHDDPSGATTVNRRTKAVQPAKVYDRKFVVRPVEGGARVWRTL